MADTVSVASSSSSARRDRLPLHSQKQLAEDIEANGGLKHFFGKDNQNLCNLLNKRVGEEDNPYGVRSDPIRAKLRRKVEYWQGLDKKDKYISDVLNPWRIVQYAARMKKNKAITPKKAANPGRRSTRSFKKSDISVNSSNSSSGSSSGKGASHKPKTPNRKPPKQVFVDKNKSNQPSTPLSPGFEERFQRMSVNKRKSRWDVIAETARKSFFNGLSSRYPII